MLEAPLTSHFLSAGHLPEDLWFFVIFMFQPHPFNKEDIDTVLWKQELFGTQTSGSYAIWIESIYGFFCLLMRGVLLDQFELDSCQATRLYACASDSCHTCLPIIGWF